MSPIAAGLLFAAGLWVGGCSLFLWVLFRSLRRLDREEDMESLWIACGGPDLERVWQTEKAL